MAIAVARICIQGKVPLLWHHFGPDALPLEKKPRSGVAGNDPEEWKRSVLVTESGQLYLQPAYIFGCLRDAARYTKRKRGTLMSIMASALQVDGELVLIDRKVPKGGLEKLPSDPAAPVYIDVRTVRNPATKARNVRYRVAASPGWKTEFRIRWEDTLISENEMRSVLNDAGQLVGLGDGRSIGLGRFTVTAFEMEDKGAKKASAKRAVASG